MKHLPIAFAHVHSQEVSSIPLPCAVLWRFFFLFFSEREGEGDWIFDEDEVLGGAEGALDPILGEAGTDLDPSLPNPGFVQLQVGRRFGILGILGVLKHWLGCLCSGVRFEVMY